MCDDDDDDDESCPCCSKEQSDRCFVITVICIISFCFLSYWYLIVIPWGWMYPLTPQGSVNWVGLVNFLGLHAGFSLLCYSYTMSIYTPPGFPDRGWTPPYLTEDQLEPLKNPDHYIHTSLKKETYYEIDYFYIPKWCKECKSWKPPRTHHCRELKACILKLDHYCPWVYNAVGYRNHKYFILFLFYSSTCLAYFLICCISRVFYELNNNNGHNNSNINKNEGSFIFTTSEIFLFILQLLFTLPITIGIISLFTFQLSCLFSNCNSVESYLFQKYKKGAKKRDVKFKWFYDYGFLYNVREVMGHSLKEWFIPNIPDHIQNGDGMTWKTRMYKLDVSLDMDKVEIIVDKNQPGPQKRK